MQTEWFRERGSNSVGRVRPCQGRCRRFESGLPLQAFPKWMNHPITSRAFLAGTSTSEIVVDFASRTKSPEGINTKPMKRAIFLTLFVLIRVSALHFWLSSTRANQPVLLRPTWLRRWYQRWMHKAPRSAKRTARLSWRSGSARQRPPDPRTAAIPLLYPAFRLGPSWA